MQPNYQNQQKEKLRSFLLIASITLAAIVIIIIIVGALGGGESSADNTHIAAPTNTPFGTEVITPFYTPTPVPRRTDGLNTSTPTGPTDEPTAAPTPTKGPLDTTQVYKKGDSGADILTIQQMLTAMGFDPGTADGQFGSSLEDAIEQFQLYAGLDSDGVAGPTTLNAILDNYEEFSPKPLSASQPLAGIVIGIDAGHQKYENTAKEQISPTSSKTAKKASDGTYGRWTGAKEYSINLQVALKLKLELEALGATVVMTRTENDVNISNAQRAQMMNDAKVDCWVQIYSNGSDDSSKKGMLVFLPKEGCMNTSSDAVQPASVELGYDLLNNAVSATGAKNLGVQYFDVLTSFNWSKYPVCLVEMGYLSNQTEDRLLVTKSYQTKIVKGLADGFVEYFTDTTN